MRVYYVTMYRENPPPPGMFCMIFLLLANQLLKLSDNHEVWSITVALNAILERSNVSCYSF